MESLKVFVALYLSVGFAKSVLSLSGVGVAAAAAQRVTGGSRWKQTVVMAVCVVIVSFAAWPLALRLEGLRFFLAYSRFGLMRQTLRTCRDGLREEALRRG